MNSTNTTAAPTTKRLKVLLGCYACAPNRGSELGTGWNFLQNIAKHHDVHAIVEQEECEDKVLQHLKTHPEATKNITFHFIKRNRYRLLRKIWPPSYYWTYRIWQKKAYRLACKLDEQENFDLVHQITLVGYREPGYLWQLNKPFIWGPLGGFTQTAWCLLPYTGLHGILYFGMRNLLNIWQKHFSYAARRVAKIAHTIFAADPQGIQDIQNIWHREPNIMREVGTHEYKTSTQPPHHQPCTPLRICWAGQLIPLKALNILLYALPLCRSQIHVDVIGSGIMKSKWEKLASRLNISHLIHFHGNIPHDKVQQIMQQCHVFCHTSIKEGGTATVVLEALQNGLPVLALNHCGHATVITPECGQLIPIISRKQIIQDIAITLDSWAQNEELRFKLAVGALKRSRDFTWERIITQLNEVYSNAASIKNQKEIS